MKPGDFWKCPHCGKDSFLKKDSVMEGWTKKGEVLRCALCSAFVADYQPDSPEEQLKSGSLRQKKALEDIFGKVDLHEEKNVLTKESSHFCRDCKHRVINAFRIFCYKHKKNVNPMDDCCDF